MSGEGATNVVLDQAVQALVEQGTTPRQRVYCATLATLSEVIGGAGVRSPALLIVGEVVKLRLKLTWFQPGAPARPESRLGVALAK